MVTIRPEHECCRKIYANYNESVSVNSFKLVSIAHHIIVNSESAVVTLRLAHLLKGCSECRMREGLLGYHAC